MLFLDNCPLVIRIYDMVRAIQDLVFSRFVSKLGAKKTFERLIARLDFGSKGLTVRVQLGYILPNAEILVWQFPIFPQSVFKLDTGVQKACWVM